MYEYIVQYLYSTGTSSLAKLFGSDIHNKRQTHRYEKSWKNIAMEKLSAEHK
jgi:hypothetical protein